MGFRVTRTERGERRAPVAEKEEGWRCVSDPGLRKERRKVEVCEWPWTEEGKEEDGGV